MERAFVRRVAVGSLVVLGMGAAAGILVAAYDVFLLLFAGILIAVLLRGLARRVCSHTPLGFGASLAVVGVLIVAIPVATILLLAPELQRQFVDLAKQLPDAAAHLREQILSVDWMQPLLDRLPDTSLLQTPRGDVLGRITGFFSTTFGLFANVLIVVAVGAYLAADAELYRAGTERLFPVRHRPRVRALLDDLGATLGWWLAAKFASMAVVGALTWAGLALLGVPLAMPLALIASLLTFIPNIGPLLSVVPAAMLAVVQSSTMLLYVLLLYAGVQFVETYLVTPFIQKRMVSLPPALTLLAQVLAGVLAGGLGLLLAAPLTAVVLVLVRRIYLEGVLGERPGRMGPQ